VEALILDLLEWVAVQTREKLRRSDGCLAHVMPQTPGLGGGEWSPTCREGASERALYR